jgi:hypothetical protein
MISSVSVWLLQEPALPNSVPDLAPAGTPMRLGFFLSVWRWQNSPGKYPIRQNIVERNDNLTVARTIYRGRVSQYPGRLVMLCDRARVLARSGRPETMP